MRVREFADPGAVVREATIIAYASWEGTEAFAEARRAGTVRIILQYSAAISRAERYFRVSSTGPGSSFSPQGLGG